MADAEDVHHSAVMQGSKPAYWEFFRRGADTGIYWTWRRIADGGDPAVSPGRFSTYGEVIRNAINCGFDPRNENYFVTTDGGTIRYVPEVEIGRAPLDGSRRRIRPALLLPDRLRARKLLDFAILAQGASKGNIQLVVEDGALEIAVQRGFHRSFLKHFERVRINDTSACGRALHAAGPVVIADVQRDPQFAPHRAIAASAGFRAVQSMPLLDSSSKLVGMLSVHYAQPLPFPGWRLPRLRTSASSIVTFLERG